MKSALRNSTRVFCRFGPAVLACLLLCLAGYVNSAQGQDDLPALGDGPPPLLSDDRPAEPASTTDAPAAAETEVLPPAEGTQAGQVVEMNPEGTFNLSVAETDVKLILRQLSLQARKSIVLSPDVVGVVTLDLYDVDFQKALDAVLHSAGLRYQEKNNVIYIYTRAEYETIGREVVTRVFHLSYLTATDAKNMLLELLSADGKVTFTPPGHVGVEAETTNPRESHNANEIIVVQDYVENVERIEQVLRQIDVRPAQVLIEATILSVKLDDTDQMGVDWEVLMGRSFNSGGFESNLSANPTIPAANQPLISNGTVKTFNNPQAMGSTSFAGGVGDGGLSFAMTTSNVAVLIRALEEMKDTTILANPKILVVNKQRGIVQIGKEDGYVASSTTTDVAETSTVEFLNSGTVLELRPFVGKDDYIRMEIHPELSTGSVSVPVGGTTALPTKEVTQVTTNIMVRDGRTLVIGGLFREETNRDRQQVPVAGNIPIMGDLFRGTNDTVIREELIVLITPHIIRVPEDEEVSERYKKLAEDVSLGARDGLTWWSRARLSDTFVVQARKNLAEGNVDKANWYTDLSLAAYPARADAVELKERIEPRASWYRAPRKASTEGVIEEMILDETNWEDHRSMPHYMIQPPPPRVGSTGPGSSDDAPAPMQTPASQGPPSKAEESTTTLIEVEEQVTTPAQDLPVPESQRPEMAPPVSDVLDQPGQLKPLSETVETPESPAAKTDKAPATDAPQPDDLVVPTPREETPAAEETTEPATDDQPAPAEEPAEPETTEPAEQPATDDGIMREQAPDDQPRAERAAPNSGQSHSGPAAIRTESIRLSSQPRVLDSSSPSSALPETLSDVRPAQDASGSADASSSNRPASKDFFFVDQSEMKTIRKADSEKGEQTDAQTQSSITDPAVPETASEDTFFVIDTPE